jgi:hypothetical protein
MRPPTLDRYTDKAIFSSPENVADRNRARSGTFNDLVGTARRGKGHAGPDHRQNDEVEFIPFSAVLAGIKEIKEIMASLGRWKSRPADDSFRG